jgi:4-diphosphocytidyl-2-C-methyl-D-erythritol kinase
MRRPDAPAPARDIAPAKLNLALHVRGRLGDGRHALETIFAFCTDGDRLSAGGYEDIWVESVGQFADDVPGSDNLVVRAALMLRERRGFDILDGGAWITLDKRLPVASGLGGGSADAAAALRLLTALWRMNPSHASEIAPKLGSDVPACLLSLPMRGEGAGDELTPIDLSDLAGIPVLIVNPLIPLSTAAVFERWDGIDRGPLGDWREGRNDLEAPAIALVPQIADILDWLRNCQGANFVRMSGSGASCFALFGSEEARDLAAASVPGEWWHLATNLR